MKKKTAKIKKSKAKKTKVKPKRRRSVAKPTLSSLGAKLTKTFKKSTQPPIFIAMGTDSFIFYSDLIRKVQVDMHCEFSTQEHISSASAFKVSGKEVVLVFAKKPATASLTSIKKLFANAGASNVLTVNA